MKKFLGFSVFFWVLIVLAVLFFVFYEDIMEGFATCTQSVTTYSWYYKDSTGKCIQDSKSSKMSKCPSDKRWKDDKCKKAGCNSTVGSYTYEC